MARRRTATVKRTSDVVVVTPPAAAPLARRRSGGTRRRRKTTRRRAPARLGGGASTKNLLMGTAMGGFAYGFVEKTWGAQIPSLPFIGKSGAIALACYFLAPKHPLIKDVGVAAAAIAGYSFGKTGVVSGEYDGYSQ